MVSPKHRDVYVVAMHSTITNLEWPNVLKNC